MILALGAVIGVSLGLTLTPIITTEGHLTIAMWLEAVHRVCTSVGGLGTFIALIFVGIAAGDKARQLVEEGTSCVLPDFSDSVRVIECLRDAQGDCGAWGACRVLCPPPFGEPGF